MKLSDLFEEYGKEPTALAMLRRVLKNGDVVYMHHCNPDEELKFDKHADRVTDVDAISDHISMLLAANKATGSAEADTITDVSEFERARLIKRQSKSKRKTWDLYILS